MREAMKGPQADRLEDRAVQAWRELRSFEGGPVRIEFLKEKPSSRRLVCRLVGADPTGSAVIGKRCRRPAGLIEHTIYEKILPHLPLPSLQYYGLVEEAEGDFSWLFLEDVGEQASSDLRADDTEFTTQWLGLLHTSARQVASPDLGLPMKEPRDYLKRLESVRHIIRSSTDSRLQRDDWVVLDAMVRHCDRLASRWDRVMRRCEGAPSTLVHGDFVPRNRRLKRRGLETVLVAFDWAEAGWGIPATDLLNVDVAAYWSVVRDRWPWLNAQAIQQWTTVGKIFRCLDAIYWELEGRNHRLDKSRMKHLKIYGSWLADAVRAVSSAA